MSQLSSQDPAANDADHAWYYAHNRQKVGPVALSELKQLATAGKLLPTDMVLRQGTSQWQQAAVVPGLFPKDEQMSVAKIIDANPADSDQLL